MIFLWWKRLRSAAARRHVETASYPHGDQHEDSAPYSVYGESERGVGLAGGPLLRGFDREYRAGRAAAGIRANRARLEYLVYHASPRGSTASLYALGYAQREGRAASFQWNQDVDVWLTQSTMEALRGIFVHMRGAKSFKESTTLTFGLSVAPGTCLL